jgi:hypothetical protein
VEDRSRQDPESHEEEHTRDTGAFKNQLTGQADQDDQTCQTQYELDAQRLNPSNPLCDTAIVTAEALCANLFRLAIEDRRYDSNGRRKILTVA